MTFYYCDKVFHSTSYFKYLPFMSQSVCISADIFSE